MIKKMKIIRSDEYKENLRLRMLKEWSEGRGHGFKKGNQLGKNTAGKNHGQWNGGFKYFKTDSTIYRWIKISLGKYKAEHRIVMEKFLGRLLKKTEAVHHIDGNGLNNDISNLELLSWADHKKKHSGSYIYGDIFKCTYCSNNKHFAKGMCNRCYSREYARKKYGFIKRTAKNVQ